MRKFVIILLCGSLGLSTFAQQEFPVFPVPDSYRLKSGSELPVRVDNSGTKFFPPIINQHGWSCNQASSIGYTLTYELNRLRDKDSKVWENQYNQLFPWNFLNRCNPGVGVSYFDTWEIVKAAGCPTDEDFQVYNETNFWMSGYDNYYRAMKNRVIQNYSIPVGTPEGLNILKQYLVDHFDGSETGGVANIQIASGGMKIRNASQDAPDPGAPVLWSFGTNVGHALTIVGYDDEMGLDLNGDGKISNDVDRNNDGVIDMKDWEMGAVYIANTWGKGWSREGMCYVLYSCLAREGYDGGIWNRSVHVVKAVKEYEPVLTMKVLMSHTSRNKFRLLAGVSKDPEATEPDQIIGFPHFNFQGNAEPLWSRGTADSTLFELGLDISSLTTDIAPGEEVRFFLLVDEKDPADVGQGVIHSFSVINYNDGVHEEVSPMHDIAIANEATTTLHVNAVVDFNSLKIDHEEATSVKAGEVFTRQLEAEGGTAPYLWELVHDYTEKHFERSFPEEVGEVISEVGNEHQFTWIDLPFTFPFYGDDFVAIIVDKDGALHFNNQYYDYPYAINTDLAFRVRKSIIPFGRTLTYKDSDKIAYKATDSLFQVTWEATVEYEGEEYDANVAAYLYPDGRIEFHYGLFTQPTGNAYPWIGGISNGDARRYKFATVSELGILFQNYGVCFEPNQYPAEVSLTDDGLLTCKPDQNDRIWNIEVQVRDKNNQINFAAIPVSTIDWGTAEILSQNYPNPFRTVSTISFKVPAEQLVSLRVYDTAGREIKRLVDENLLAGEYNYYWNGTDTNNRNVDPGIYFYRLNIGDKREARKVMLMR